VRTEKRNKELGGYLECIEAAHQEEEEKENMRRNIMFPPGSVHYFVHTCWHQSPSSSIITTLSILEDSFEGSREG